MLQNIKPKLLICTTFQFGYLVDPYKYCEYSKDKFEITYLCWDYNQPKICLKDINVHYVSREGNLIIRNYRLLKNIYNKIQEGSFDKIFVVYIKGIFLIKLLFPKVNIYLDIRTGSVQNRWVQRVMHNLFLKLESLFFNKISVISDGVAQSLGISEYSLLPLGGENFKIRHLDDLKITFIYVGTLQFREFLTFVKAFHQFSVDTIQNQEVFLRVIGDSPSGELQQIQKYLEINKIKNVELLGRINQIKLPQYFDDADIGVSYIPIRSWFEYQPPTKTYEYLISGLPVLATDTFENRRIINKNNGVLIKDNVESIIGGLHQIINNYNNQIYNYNKIRNDSEKFLWKYIVKNRFEKILNED